MMPTLIPTVFFILFSLGAITGGLGMILARSAVHAVLWLIFAFLNGAGLLILLGADFLAMMFIVVYVGAVAVLFLFVVMMVEGTSLSRKISTFPKAACALGFLLLGELLWAFSDATVTLPLTATGPIADAASLGRALFTDYALIFEIVGLILLVAMVGAVVLTQRDRRPAQRQNRTVQLQRSPANTLTRHTMAIGEGIQHRRSPLVHAEEDLS